MKRTLKKLGGIFIALCMVLSLLPMPKDSCGSGLYGVILRLQVPLLDLRQSVMQASPPQHVRVKAPDDIRTPLRRRESPCWYPPLRL